MARRFGRLPTMMSTPQSPVIAVMMTGAPLDRAIRATWSSNSVPDIAAVTSSWGCAVRTPRIAPRTKWGAAAKIIGATAATTRLHSGVAPSTHTTAPRPTAAITCHFSATRRMVEGRTDVDHQPHRVSPGQPGRRNSGYPICEMSCQLQYLAVDVGINLHIMSDELAELEGQTPVEHALAGGDPQRVGSFKYYFAEERWEWSPQVQRMHGYEPGSVEPTTDL